VEKIFSERCFPLIWLKVCIEPRGNHLKAQGGEKDAICSSRRERRGSKCGGGDSVR
jgi:hypothetical protein